MRKIRNLCPLAVAAIAFSVRTTPGIQKLRERSDTMIAMAGSCENTHAQRHIIVNTLTAHVQRRTPV